MSTDTPDFENANVDEIEDEIREEQAEKKQEMSEGARLANEISQSRRSRTVHVEIEGVKVPFEPPAGEKDEVEDMLGQLAGKDEDEISDEEYAEYKRARRRVDEILEEKCKTVDYDSGAFTAQWWQKNFVADDRQRILGKLSQGGEEGERAVQFRQR